MTPGGILFDKDNTLTDLAAFTWKASVLFAERLAAMAGRPKEEALLRKLLRAVGYDDGRLIPDSPVVAGTNRDVAEACREVLSRCGTDIPEGDIPSLAADFGELCRLEGTVKGLVDASYLRSLKNRGIHLAVVTSDDYIPSMKCLKECGMDSCFDMILSADRVPHPKPAPDSAEIFRNAFGLSPSGIWMVGDCANDMRFAENAGIMGILLSGGSGPLPEGAACRIRKLPDLDILLDRDCKEEMA